MTIDWDSIRKIPILILKEGLPERFTFLNNGKKTTFMYEGKTLNKYEWKIVDLNDNNLEKDFSTLSKRLLLKLKPFIPLEGKAFEITMYRFGNDVFDIDFKIESLKTQKPTKFKTISKKG